jgi:excisionase family DNA binding protein
MKTKRQCWEYRENEKGHRDLKESIVGKILTLKGLAEYSNLTEVTIYKYVSEGKIPVFKIGSRWRFEKDKIDNLLKMQK